MHYPCIALEPTINLFTRTGVFITYTVNNMNLFRDSDGRTLYGLVFIFIIILLMIIFDIFMLIMSGFENLLFSLSMLILYASIVAGIAFKINLARIALRAFAAIVLFFTGIGCIIYSIKLTADFEISTTMTNKFYVVLIAFLVSIFISLYLSQKKVIDYFKQSKSA